jgi:hypothetical protein
MGLDRARRKFLADVRIDISHAVAHALAFDPVPTLKDLGKLWKSWSERSPGVV